MTLVVALKKFFGLKPNQTLKEFLDETRKLTPEDKDEFTALLKAEGYEVE